MVVRVESGEWHWDGVRLGLLEPEASLLAALLREPCERRLPHVWIPLARHQPISPPAGAPFSPRCAASSNGPAHRVS